MADFIEYEGFSLVSLVIPQARLHRCLESVLTQWPYDAVQFDCRGTVTREHWFQAFLPNMNPECEYLQFLIPDHDLSGFMQFCIEVNDLHLPSSGAVFSARCVYYASNTHSLANRRGASSQGLTSKLSPLRLKNNLYAIFALIQFGRTENAIKAAMQAGSHGPIVYFVEGRGIRDRVGWLKITKKPYDEVILVLVEDIDRARVKEALVSASGVNALGGGIIYEMPIDSGLVNLPTSISNKSRLASNEQIIAAVDQLMGNTHWRDNRSLTSLLDKNSSSRQIMDTENNIALCAFIPRKHAEEFLNYVLSIGIPGANVIYTKLFSRENQQQGQVSIQHELAQVRMVLPKASCPHYRAQLQQFAVEQQYSRLTFYQQEVRGVARYQFKPKAKEALKGSMYRGISS
ncbi:MAG: hypothetical protein KTR17_03560 [Cellvibrionaceae bacterium]|nr:hypothetical protein [Cellvibrionaceae bacterium]